MNTSAKSRFLALTCVIALLFSALATYPVAETGMNDDWSYIKTTQIFVQTGHIAYNGWGAMMLGWQLLLGAIFAKLFGPSFTAIRASTLLVALVAAFLTQRVLVRAGATSRNATFGTLAIVLGPLFLPLALSFLTDTGGYFVIVLCLYACLRTVQACTDRAALAWLTFAALSNALGGTVRQIAWLGVLVMVPCAIWLVRRRQRMIVVGAILYLISLIIIFGSLHWFHSQPYSRPEPLIPEHLNSQNLRFLVARCFRAFSSFVLFLLPILLVFLPALSLRTRRTRTLFVVGGLLCAIGGILLQYKNILGNLLNPVGNYILLGDGIADIAALRENGATVLASTVRLVVIAVILLVLLCFSTFLLTSRRRPVLSTQDPLSISWRNLLILIVPFTAAYLALLMPRGATSGLYDRYLLPLLLIGVLLLLRLFQDRVQPELPLGCLIFIGLFAVYAIAGTYDNFSAYRAKLTAIATLRAAGIPDAAIDAGFEHNAWLQVERFGFIKDEPQRNPLPVQFVSIPESCRPTLVELTPVMVPGYRLSGDPEACGGESRFAPVSYRGWLGFHTSTLYILNSSKILNTNAEISAPR